MKCKRPSCPDPVLYRGLCNMHYTTLRLIGKAGLVPAAPTVARVRRLSSLGWTYEMLSKASGLSKSEIQDLKHGRMSRVCKSTEEAVHAVPLEPRGSCRSTPRPEGTLRRIEALMAIGWRRQDIAAVSGVPVCAIDDIIWKRTVSFPKAIKIAAAYERLSTAPGPSKQTMARARNRGFAPPLAWDDIDNPAERPNVTGSSGFEVVDKVAVERVLAGHAKASILTETERRYAAAVMVRRGFNRADIGRYLAATDTEVGKWLEAA